MHNSIPLFIIKSNNHDKKEVLIDYSKDVVAFDMVSCFEFDFLYLSLAGCRQVDCHLHSFDYSDYIAFFNLITDLYGIADDQSRHRRHNGCSVDGRIRCRSSSRGGSRS